MREKFYEIARRGDWKKIVNRLPESEVDELLKTLGYIGYINARSRRILARHIGEMHEAF